MGGGADLKRRLDAADSSQWEQEYCRERVEFTQADVQATVTSGAVYAAWLTFRFDVGPPGVPLPPLEEAIDAILRQDGTPLDAYCLVFAPLPWPEHPPVDKVLELLENTTVCALKGERASFAIWLASRTGLAALALGVPERAWALLDELAGDSDRHSHRQLLALFAPLRGNAMLERSPWIQLAICNIWPHLGVRCVPRLPWPAPDENMPPLEDVLNALSSAGAADIRNLVEKTAAALATAFVEDRDEEPLVRELRRRALVPGSEPPVVDDLPPWFESWAQAMSEDGEAQTARLAGLLLHRMGTARLGLAAALVARAARAADLPMLRQCIDAPELRDLIDEIATATGNLPAEVADALVAEAIPFHVDHGHGLICLVEHLDMVESLATKPDGFVARLVTNLRTVTAARTREQEQALPLCESLRAAVRRAADRLPDPHTLRAEEVEREAARIPVPEISTALFELALGNEDLPPLERLLQALALRRLAAGTIHETPWVATAANAASTAIYDLRALSLFPLRLRLLDEIISHPSPILSLADLHFKRANTRQAIERDDPDLHKLAVDDFFKAIALARIESNARVRASAISSLAKLLVRLPADGEMNTAELRAELEREIAAALELPLQSSVQVSLHQAHAHLLRATNSKDAILAFEQAQNLLTQGDPFWSEIGAEIVNTLVKAEMPDIAAERGLDLLQRSSCIQCVELGMLHMATGQALAIIGRTPEARRELDAGLSLLRGRDWYNEVLGRCHLAHLGIVTNDRKLAEEQIRFLRDRQEDLSAAERSDLHRLETAAARAWGEAASHRSALERELTHAHDALARTRAALELAHLDLETTGSTTELDKHLLEALGLPQDREIESLVSHLACDFTKSIQPATRDLVLDWARRRHLPAVVATLLHHMGNSEEACAHLRDALQGDLSAPNRLRCMNALLTMLGEKDRPERIGLCRDIERHLENGDDNPVVLLNLAVALHLDANGDQDVLRRAWRHGQRGLAKASGREAIQHGNSALCRILIDLLSALARESSEPVVELASWLLEERDVSSEELASYRLTAANLLLLPGPFIHPRVLDIANWLIDLVKPSPSTDIALKSAEERVTWIACRNAGHDMMLSDGAKLRGPLDDAPQWLVDAVAGRQVEVAPEALAAGLSKVRTALALRPDVADHVLAELMNGQANSRGAHRESYLQMVRDCVQSITAPNEPEKAWAELERSVAVARRDSDHTLLGSIEGHIQRQRGAAPPPTSATQSRVQAPLAIGARNRALQCFDEGIRSMKIVQDDPLGPDAEMRINTARELLEEGVMHARKEEMPELADLVISLANAWKTAPGANIKKALSLYESADRLCVTPEQRAKLWKVHADALLRRGAPDDLRRAERLLERSLDIRQGVERAATLFSAAQVAFNHPDLDEAERVIRAAEHLMAAVHAGRSHSEEFLEPLLDRLSAWSRIRPNDPRPGAYRNELKAIYPHRQKDVEGWKRLPLHERLEHVFHAMKHPAFSAYVAIRSRLMSPSERNDDDLTARLGPSIHAQIEEEAERKSLLRRPDEAERLLATLTGTDDDEAKPGRIVGKVFLIAHLTRLGRGGAGLVRAATEEAIAAISTVTDNTVQAMLLSELAGVWMPDDHSDDPVRDFGLAVSLLRRAIAFEDAEGPLLDESRGRLARALRYSPDGDIQANLRECRRLYQAALERARATGDPNNVANLLHNLGDVESQIGDGSYLDRLREAERLIAEAATVTNSPEKKAQYTASLAWERAQIGFASLEESREEGIQWLRRAEATFEQVDLNHLSPVARRHLEGNRTTCTATLARFTRGRSAEITVWRNRLDFLIKQGASYAVAIAQHNLANALMFGEDVLASELAEGLRLSAAAAAVRTIEADARHHWQTSFNAGLAILTALQADRSDLLPWPPHLAWNEARRWFHQAIKAAQALGRGEELAKAAFALGELAGRAASSGQCVDTGEEAWKALCEASAYLFFDTAHREREAWFALHVGISLAYRLANEALPVASPGVAFVLQGDRAEIVRRWIMRSQVPLRRPSRARLMRPAGLTANVWTEWQMALSQRDPRIVNEVLRRIHEVAPSFLSEDGEMGVTWRWLEGHPGSIAVSVVLTPPIALAVLAQLGPSGQQRSWIIGLRVPPPPISAEELAREMRGAAMTSTASAAHSSMVTWVRRHITQPVLSFLGDTPSAVLWLPGPGLRFVSPGAIWEGLPVATSMSIELPDLGRSPGRPRSTLVALADPGKSATDPTLCLGEHGLAALERLVAAATRRGSVRSLASAGPRFGRALLGDHAHVRDTPASAHDLLAEGIEHDVIVILAHGEMDTPESAALLCIDRSGAIEKLDVEMLARNPSCFAGATILLLSCESGRIGAALAEPAGIAGTLISAGARVVVAPLWPVRLNVAARVGEAVLEGLADGEEPSRLLARLQIQGGADAPLLGRPPPTLADRETNEALQHLAFVTWVG
ncbi:MAG: CHAT domain-containing protein [Polyangiaceae bacterium]|nr:CHAT domain-containing protein [Polyangiaceae bacterium]